MVWARSCGGNAGGDAFARLDRDGEGGLVARAVVAAHQRQAELLDAVAGQRQADQAARVAGHEVDRVGRGELRGDDQVAFVLAVLVIDQDEHAAVARFLDQFLGGGEVLRQLGGADVVHGWCLAGGVGDSNCRGRGSGLRGKCGFGELAWFTGPGLEQMGKAPRADEGFGIGVSRGALRGVRMSHVRLSFAFSGRGVVA